MSEVHDAWLEAIGIDVRRLRGRVAGAASDAEAEEAAETDVLLTTRMLPLLKLAMKGERMHALVASAGKEAAVLLARKPIAPSKRKLLAERLGAGGAVKFFAGHCALDPDTRATTFVLPVEVQGMAKKLKRALLAQTGLKVNKVSCRGADGAADHDLEDDGAAEADDGLAGSPLLEKVGSTTFLADTGPGAPAPGGGGDGTAKQSSKPKAKPPAGGRSVPYSIPVTRPMDNLEFSILVDMTVKGMTRDQAVENNRDPAARVRPATFVVTAQHVKQGFVVVNYIHADLAPVPAAEVEKADATFKGYGGARQDDVNRRTNEEFWKQTGLPAGTKLDPKAPNFKVLAQAWKETRTDVVRQQALYDRIPPEARSFLKFAPGGVPVTEANIDKIVAIAQKVLRLTPEEMAEYWMATEARTDDVDTFAASVDAYLRKVDQRREASEKLDAAHDKLVGKEELLRLYKRSRESHWPASDEFGVVDPNAVEHNVAIEQARRALGPMLQRWGYADVAAFEADVGGYETAFRDQAIATADKAMDRREHELWRFQEEVLSADSVQGMFEALRDANAKRDELIRDRSLRIDGGDGKTFTNWALIRALLRPVLEKAIEGDPGLRRLIELRKQEDPNFTLDDDMVDLLSTANSADELTRLLTRLLEERREGIAETRQLLKDKPDKIWKFDKALAYGKAHSDAEPGSIQDQVVNDKIQDEASSELGKKILVGLLAIGAGLLTFGEGSVAVLGGAAALGIGAADAWDTYSSYVEEKAANRAGMSSNDPSFAWVVLALATLPLDVLALGSAIKAAKAAPHIAAILDAGTDTGKAVRAFNAAGEAIETTEDAAKALARLEQGLATAQKDVRAAIVRAARAEAEAKAAWAAARAARAGRAMGYIDPIASPLADLVVSFAYPVAKSIRKGLTKFDAFLKTGFAKALIKDVGSLSPEAMVKLQKAFAEAKAGWEVAAKRAVDLGMTDVEIERAMTIWAGKPDLGAGRFVTEILEPMAQARKSVPGFAKVMQQTETLPGGVANLEEALVKAAGDPAYARQLGPYLQDLRQEIEALDPAVRKALPDAARESLDTISREAGEQLLKDADIKTATSLRQAPPRAELDPARMKAYEWNAEQKVVDQAEAIGGARLEKVLGGNLEKASEEGVDFVVKGGADTKVSLKGPLVNKKTGGAFPIKNKNLTQLAEAVVHDVTVNTATRQMVVDMMGLSVEQRAFLQAEIKRILDETLAKGTPGLINKPILFME